MSAAAPAVPVNTGWPFRKSQALAIVWMELRKNFVTKRGFWIYLLAAAPADRDAALDCDDAARGASAS